MSIFRTSARVLARCVRRLGEHISVEVSKRRPTTGGLQTAEYECLVRRILSSIHNNSILLIGPPGTGKTSILLYLKGCLTDAEDTTTDFYPVYIDLHGVPEEVLFATFGDAVLGQLAFAPPSKVERYGSDYGHRELSRDFRSVVRVLRERSTKPARLALLVDGIDELNNYKPRTTQKVRSLFMASLAESLVMVASAVEIDKYWEEEGSPWYNFFEEIEIPSIRGEPGCPG